MRYYGYKLNEVMDLDVCKYNTLVRLMYINEARDTLKMQEATHYPTFTEGSKEKIKREYNKIGFPESFVKKKTVDFADVKRISNGG